MAKRFKQEDTGPYTVEDYRTLRQLRADIAQLRMTMDKARTCGVDCSMLDTMLNQSDQQLAAIEANFMTPAPR